MKRFSFKSFLKHSALVIVAMCSVLVVALLICNLCPVRIEEKAKELKAYCIRYGYNTDYGILADYSRFSLQRRFYVYDFKQEKIIMRSLSGHGKGGNSTIFNADFSNQNGSNCSSIGHYKLGRQRHMYNKPIVPAIELTGLDKTNSNALSRGILIHPSAIPLSLGCITLPLNKYLQLADFLNSKPKNIIMWVYE